MTKDEYWNKFLEIISEVGIKKALMRMLEQVAKEQREKAIKDCKNAFCLGYHEKEGVWEWDEEAIKRIDNHIEYLKED